MTIGTVSNDKHAYAGQLSSVTHIRALLVLHNHGMRGSLSRIQRGVEIMHTLDCRS
jgi:hypothetical protein